MAGSINRAFGPQGIPWVVGPRPMAWAGIGLGRWPVRKDEGSPPKAWLVETEERFSVRGLIINNIRQLLEELGVGARRAGQGAHTETRDPETCLELVVSAEGA